MYRFFPVWITRKYEPCCNTAGFRPHFWKKVRPQGWENVNPPFLGKKPSRPHIPPLKFWYKSIRIHTLSWFMCYYCAIIFVFIQAKHLTYNIFVRSLSHFISHVQHILIGCLSLSMQMWSVWDGKGWKSSNATRERRTTWKRFLKRYVD